MARIYSWQLTDTKYAYITGINNDEPFVGNRLKREDYEIVTDKVDSMSVAQYSANFDKLCVLCNQYGLDPTKEGKVSAVAFYDTTNLGEDFMVVLVGKDGKDGEAGKQGPRGPKGEDGVSPDAPIPYISVTAYASSGNRDIAPETPREDEIIITWNEKTKQYTFNDTTKRWWISDSDANDNDGDGSDKSIIWQSSAVYNDKGIVSPWSKPIRITGENGEPGADGNNLEFIYQRRTHQWINPERPTSKNENKYVPVDEGWTGSPTGIDDAYRYEYMCQRRKDANGNWGEWEGPMLWSRWGDDGKDGDGVEYAYFTTNGTEPKIRYDVDINSDEYQKNEYLPYVQMPNSNGTYVDVTDSEGNLVRWYDNPRQIDATNNRAQWVIIRKRRIEEGLSKSTWGEFSDPALWSMYGEKGDPGVEGLNVYERKMYCSYDVNDAPDVQYTSFDPGFPWAPAIPKEKGPNQGIWAIEAYIKLNTKTKEQELCWYDGSTEERVIDESTGERGVPRWSVPYIIEGRDGADFVHNREEIFKCVALGKNGEKVPPPLPTGNEKDEDYYVPSSEGWSQYMEGLSDETPLCYMCYRYRTYDEWWGSWSDWQGPFIFTQLGTQGPPGLDGTDGKDGTNVEYVYTRTFDENPPMLYVPAEDYDNGNFQKNDYLPFVNTDTNLKWHDEPRGVDEGTPYEWVALRVRKYNEASEVVEWSEFSEPGIFAKYGFNGKDGKDIEYVYALTKTYEKPRVKNYDNDSPVAQSPEFYPELEWNGEAGGVSGNTENGKTYWMDNAKDVTVDWPYQWEIIRKRIGTPKPDNSNLFDYKWEAYTNENVTLHSKWGRDGDQGRQGVAGVAGIHYEMRFIQARQDEDDNIYLYVPEIKNNAFTGKFIEVHYVDDNNVEQDAWINYWYNTKHPDIDGEDVTFLYQTRNLNRTYFPLYTDTLTAKDYPYMFFIQSRISVERTEIKETNPNNKQEEIVGIKETEVLESGQWESPARLTGQQGIQGPEGKRGPMLYSAGVYAIGKTYYTDGNKKPYVLDPANKEYYYLEKGNRIDSTGEYWYAEMDGNDDSKDNIPSKDAITNDPHWVKMEQFDVILANVGIFRSALVGSGVFYGEWFYSQNGTLNDGTLSETTKTENSDGSITTISSRYEEFDPNTRILTKTNGGTNNTTNEPYIQWGPKNKFKPFLAFNLLDGSGWFAGTNILWDSKGNMNLKGAGIGSLGGDAFTWDNENIYINKNLIMDSGVSISWKNINGSEIEKSIKEAKDAADAADARMDEWVADGYISKLELQGINDEYVFITADKNDIDKKCAKYEIGVDDTARSEYNTAYTNYETSLKSIIASLTGTTERVPSGNLETCQETYYDKRTKILERIVTAEKEEIAAAKKVADDANKRMNDWVADGVISKLELQGIKDEKVFITADKTDIDTKYTKYNLTDDGSKTAYNTAYETYLSALNTVINSFTGTTESVSASGLDSSQKEYYDKRTAILERIVIAEHTAIKKAKEVADDAKKRMDGWVSDKVITRFELQGIKDEHAFIVADNTDINTKCTTYNLTGDSSSKTAYDTAYTNYKATLDEIIDKFNGNSSPEQVDVPSALTTQQSTFYSARTDILAAIVGAEQSYASSAASKALEDAKLYSDGNVEIMKKYAEDYANGIVPTDEYITSITEKAITTDWLNARNITAAGITAAGLSAHTATIGTIASENIDVDKLYVKKLNTKGKGNYGSGTISIEDDIMKVFDSTSTKEVVCVTGKQLSTMDNLPNSASVVQIAPYYLIDTGTNFANVLDSKVRMRRLVVFTIPDDGYQYKVSTENPDWRLDLSTNSATPGMKKSIVGCVDIIITNNPNYNDTSTSHMETYSMFSNLGDNPSGQAGWGTGATEIYSYNGDGNVNGKVLPPGTYYIYGKYIFGIPSTGDWASLNQIKASLTITTAAITIEPDINRCEISSYGFRYIVDKKKYVEFDKKGNFTMVNGKAGVRLTSGGTLQIASNTLNDKYSSSLTWYEIMPRTYKFKLQGDTNQHMTVLTIGESTSV